MKTYAIDYETYYDDECSITELGPYNYVRHPRFEAYLVSIHGEDFSWAGKPEDAPWEMLHGQRLIAHNATFEIVVSQWLRHLGIIPATWNPAEWLDTIDLVRYLGLSHRVNLKAVAKVALGKTLSKDPRTKAKGMTGEEFRADPEAWTEICDYCLEDSVVCYDVWMKYQHLWPAQERRIAHQTRQIQLSGVPVDVQLIESSRVVLNAKREECLESMPWYPERKPMSLAAFRDTCDSLELDPPLPKSTAKDDPDFRKFVDHHQEEHPWVTAMSDLRSANRTEKLLMKMENFTTPEISRTHIGLTYFGAKTGRWSGESVNLQNQTKKPVFGVDTRAAIRAGEGKTFVIYDYCQIEPRVLAWLAGDTEFLDMVREGMSVYEAHARLTMGWTGGVLKKEDPGKYAFAKMRVLGLGYGLGEERFFEGCKTNPDFIANDITVSREEAGSVVKSYRRDTWKVPALWKALDQQVRSMIGNRSGSLMLPSGRPLRYYHIRTVPEERWGRMQDSLYVSSYLNDRRGHGTFGGELCENVTQAVARDVLAEACLYIEDTYDIVPTFTVHDEAVYEVPKSEAGEWDVKIQEGMLHTSAWAKDIPLEIEGMITDVYTK